jgi:tRNA G10  N-methylase Trm11
MNSHQYFFQLGTTTDACLAEAQAVVSRLGFGEVTQLNKQVALLNSPKELTQDQLNLLQNTLGGTIKIAAVFEVHETPLDEKSLEKAIADHLALETVHRFAIAEFGRDNLPAIDSGEIKFLLQKAGKRMNYVEANRYGASAAQLKRATSEMWVVHHEGKQYFAWSRTVQSIDDWSFRDIEKPVRERKRGMLPPKIARMMLNLALADREPEDTVVLDPFVGTGTVLIEASMLGMTTLLGSDIDQAAIYGTTKNLEWWKEQSELEFSFELARKEVAHLGKNDFRSTPQIIVTEPFLGRLTPKAEDIPNVARGLEKLYKGMVKAFTHILPEGGRVAVILPTFRIQQGNRTRDILMNKTIEDFKAAGFELQHGPFIVGHPDAVTQRTVYVLEYMPYGSR